MLWKKQKRLWQNSWADWLKISSYKQNQAENLWKRRFSAFFVYALSIFVYGCPWYNNSLIRNENNRRRRTVGRSGSRLWRWAATVGVIGLLMMMGAILVANRWENMFGIAVLLGLVCTWIALLMLAAAWWRELWHSFRRQDYVTMAIWLALGLLVLFLFFRRIF